MEKRASNTFVGGMVTDRHPLSSQNTELIDAQNIDLIQVGEGYQLILQKREGNLELEVAPPEWSSIMPYKVGEYAIADGNIYVALTDNVDISPLSSETDWALSVYVGVAPAGLPDGFIPLAVKEFNNIAYIISVNPTTGAGEIGTFPSPMYNNYIYEIGSEMTTPIIGDGVVDLRIRYDYEFSITGVPNTGIEETINTSDKNYLLTNAGFTIKNEGLQIDTYRLETNETGGVQIYVNNVLINPGVDTITLGPGASAVVTFKHQDPFTQLTAVPYYEPNILMDPTVTIISLSGELDNQSYYYYYHIAPMLGVRYAGETEYTVSAGYPTTLPVDDSRVISKTGGQTQFEWVTNDSTFEWFDSEDYTTMPSRPGDLISFGAAYVELIMGNNTLVVIRRGTYTLAGNYPTKNGYAAGTLTCVLNVEQTNV